MSAAGQGARKAVASQSPAARHSMDRYWPFILQHPRVIRWSDNATGTNLTGWAGGCGGARTEPACSTWRSRGTWLGLARGCSGTVPCFRARSFSGGGWARGPLRLVFTCPCRISCHDFPTWAAAGEPMACLQNQPPFCAPGATGGSWRQPGFLVRRRYFLGIQRRKRRPPGRGQVRRRLDPVCRGATLRSINRGPPGHRVFGDGRRGACGGHRPLMAARRPDPTGPDQPSEEFRGRLPPCARACPRSR
jgi:hypothetical protein